MNRDTNSKFFKFIKKTLRVIRPRFSLHYVSYTVLLFIVVFSVINLASATTPNPGHPWLEIGDGAFQVTFNQTATRTYTFPDASTTILTTNAAVTVPQGGTGVGSFTSNGVLYGNGTGNVLVTAAGTTGQCLIGTTSSAPSWGTCTTGAITTLAAIGSSPNANGATIAGSTLNLEPASASFGGVVTTGAQTFAGAKTFGTSNTTGADLAITNTGAYTGTGIFNLTANSVTGSGTLARISSTSLQSGKLLDLQYSGNGAFTGQTALNILTTGADSGSPTTYGAQISNTHSYDNVALYLNASGGSVGNKALVVNAGSVVITPFTAANGVVYATSSGVLTQTGINSGGTTQCLTQVSSGVPTWGTCTSGAVTTLAAIGSSPNANGATLSGSTLNLEPASASFGGVVTTGTQTFAGAKTFNSDAIVNTLTIGLGGGAVATNTALGYQALNAGSGASNSTAVGYQALLLASSTGNNTAVGSGALSAITTGSQNTAVGDFAGGTLNSAGNTAVGHFALGSGTAGTGNTALGDFALQTLTTGATYNIGIGYNVMSSAATGSYNIAMGRNAMVNANSTGAENTSIGHSSFNNLTTGSWNIAIGKFAGYGSAGGNEATTIDNNAILIGEEASRDGSIATTTQLTNIIAIGRHAKVSTSNSMVLGGTGADAINVGIGTTTPAQKLEVKDGNALVTNGGLTVSNTFAGGGTGIRIYTNDLAYSDWSISNRVNGAGMAIYSGDYGIYPLHISAAGVVSLGGNGYGPNTASLVATNSQSVGIGGLDAPTARLQIVAGTATASTAPLKFTSGTSLTTAEAGAVEFTTDDLFFTITTGAARKRLLMADPSGGLTSTRVPFSTTNGRLTDVAGFTFDGTSMVSLGVNTTTAGKLKLFGATSGDVTIQTNAVAGTATTQTLPATSGTLVNRVTTANGVSASNTDGALSFTLGAVTPTTVNGLTFTSNATGFSIAGGTTPKTLTVSNTLTLAGTDSTTMTFPTTTATIARTDAAQTFTGTQTFSGLIQANAGVTVAGGQNLTMSSGSGLFAQTYTGTTTNGHTITANALTTGTAFIIPHTTSVIASGGSLARISSTSNDTSTTTGTLLDLSSTASTSGTQFLQTYSGLTTGIGQSIVANALTTGSILSLSSNTGAGATGQKGINVSLAGSISSAQTSYAGYFANIHTAASDGMFNVGVYAESSGIGNQGYAGFFKTVGDVDLTGASGGTGVRIDVTSTGANSFSAGSIYGVNISNLATPDASAFTTETALNVGTGWDNIFVSAKSSLSSVGVLTLGASGSTGALKLKGTTSGTITLTTAAAAGTYSWQLPTADSSGCIQSNGSGVLSIASCGGGSPAWNSITVPTGNLTLAMDSDLTAFNYDTLTTQNAFTFASTSITSGSLLNVSSPAAANFTGSLSNISLSDATGASSNTGSLLTLTNTGTANANTSMIINHYATGSGNLAMRVNDVSGDTTPFVIDGTGNVGIGTATPGSPLTVVGNTSFTGTAGNHFDFTSTGVTGTNGIMQVTATSGSDFVPAVKFSSTQTATGSLTASYGIQNFWTSTAVVAGATVGQNAYGIYNIASKSGADTATGTYNLYGSYNSADNTGRTAAGTVNTYGGYFSGSGDANGTSSAYGGYFTATGTADTNYGIYATASGGTNNYAAIFNGGRVGIGTNTPTVALEVNTAGTGMLVKSGAYTGLLSVANSGAWYIGDKNGDGNATAIDGDDSAATIIYTANSGHKFLAGNVTIGSSTLTSLFNVGTSAQFQVSSVGVISSTNLSSGGTQCLQASSAGVISGTGSACGAGGGGMAVGGAITSGTANRVLYQDASNNLGESSNFTYDATTLGVSNASTTASNKVLNISQTGGTAGTDYGGFFSNTGSATTNVGLYTTASGGTTNLGLNVDAGQTLLGGTTLTSGTLAKLNIVSTMANTGSTTAIAGIHGDYTFNNGGTASYVQVGNRFVFNNAPTTNSNTMVGEVIRTVDNTTLANLVRGIEIVSNAGSNTAGTNTGLRSTGATFGVQAITNGSAGGVSLPAGLYAENTGTTQGDVARFYTGTMTSAPSMLQVYHDTSTFTGDGLLMDMAVSTGTFSGNFLDFKNASVQKFKVTSAGVVSMGLSGTASTNALCSSLANATAPTAGTAYEIRDCNAAPAADYAEMYPVESGIGFGDIVATGTEMVNTYDSTDGNVDWTKIKGKVTRLVKSSNSYQSNIIGIVADNYGDFTSAGHNIKDIDNPMPIALNGRVPVKVASDSDPIMPGDYLTTSSSESGKAEKANKSGQVVGKALEAWTPNSGQATVMVYVEQGFYNGVAVSQFAGIDPLASDFAKQVLKKFLNSQSSQSGSELVIDRLAVGLDIITPKLTADNVSTNIITSGTNKDIGLTLSSDGKFVIGGSTIKNADGTSSVSDPSIVFDSLGNATFNGKIKADSIEVNNLSGIQAITDKINLLSEGQVAFNLTATVMNTLSGALTVAQSDILKLQQDLGAAQTVIAGLTTSSTDLSTRLQVIEAFIKKDESGVPTGIVTQGLSVTGDGTFAGKTQFDGLSFFSNTTLFAGGVTFNGSTEFIVPPLFNKDSAGYALVKQGDRRVKILFTQPYIATPVVNTSITFETEDNVDDTEAGTLFSNDVRFIVTSKDQTGFTILLNKNAPRDIRFSWNALAVRDPSVFNSVFEGLNIDPPSSTPNGNGNGDGNQNTPPTCVDPQVLDTSTNTCIDPASPPADGGNSGDSTPPADGGNSGDSTPPADGGNSGDTPPPADGAGNPAS